MRRSLWLAALACALGFCASHIGQGSAALAASETAREVEHADAAQLRQLQDVLVGEIRRGQDAEQREIYSLGRSIEDAIRRLEEVLERRFLALLLLMLLFFVVGVLGLFWVGYRVGRLEERFFPRQKPRVLGRLGRR